MEHHEHHHEHDAAEVSATFPTDAAGLPQAAPTQVVALADNDTFELRIAPIAKRIGDDTVRMIAYNGSVPGPTLRVLQGSELVVDVVNDGDLEATVHWHGLRLENRYDGTHETQGPIPIGGRFAYRISFPDPGAYWYHPHIREDYGQELGQYGNILVDPAEPEYWPPAHRELLLTLDDIFIEGGEIAPFSRDETTFAAMGRYGNVMLVAGETAPSFDVQQGEVVRLYLTNTANTRVFNVALPGARMKLVGGDSGRVEREQFVESVVLAPSERVVVDVLFEDPGQTALEHRTPERTYTLATIEVAAEPATPSLVDEFAVLRVNPEWSDERRRLEVYADAAPDKTLAFVAEMDIGAPEGDVIYVCPMHPDVVGEESDRCPKCGMKLVAAAAPVTYVCPMHPEVVSEQPDRCPKCGMKLVDASLVTAASHEHHEHEHHEHGHEHHDDGDTEHQHPQHAHDAHVAHEEAPAGEHDHAHEGHHDAGGIEWEDDMLELNRRTTPANMRWMLVDRDTGAANHGIEWQFTVGDRVKLRLVNEMDSDHPMHHPFHIHGAGRFVVLARNGVPEANFVWKDTVLVRTGETVDILLDVTNPGRWMAHCHIAEHHESGMMFSFDVAPTAASST
jgi:FtsP/CotA-like multicopper oxidase with cupredoxin domain